MTKSKNKKAPARKSNSVVKTVVVKRGPSNKVGSFFKNLFAKIGAFFKNIGKKIKGIDSKKKSKFLKALLFIGIFVVSFILIDFFVQYLNNGASIAIVNGVRIPESEYIVQVKAADAVSQNPVISQIINTELEIQTAKSLGLKVSDTELKKELETTYTQYGGKEKTMELLKQSLLPESYLNKIVMVRLYEQKALDYFRPKIAQYTDKDVETFFKDNNAEVLNSLGDSKATFKNSKDKIVELYITNQAGQLFSKAIGDLEAKAKIQNNLTTQPTYGVLKTTITIVKNIYASVVSGLKK